MRTLKSVRYTHADKMSDSDKDEFLIPEKFRGIVALETWEVNSKLKIKGVPVKSITNYILGYGDFRDVLIDEGDLK